MEEGATEGAATGAAETPPAAAPAGGTVGGAHWLWRSNQYSMLPTKATLPETTAVAAVTAPMATNIALQASSAQL